MDQPKPHLRGNGNDNVDEFEDSKGVSTEEERALLDQIGRVMEKLIGPARMDALRGKMENVFFKILRAGKMTPKQVSDKMMESIARKGISDPVKIARIKNFSRNYGLQFVEKADDGTFKAMHEMGFGPRYFFKAVKQQTSVEDQKAYLAMAKRYRAWVENNNLKYF